jgi:uncharacterized protein
MIESTSSLLVLMPQVSPLLWWLLAAGLVLVGLVGTVLPLLPGTVLVLAGLVLAAWIDGFARVTGVAIGLIALLALLAWATDYVAAMLGARKVGASRQALIGAAAGTVLGVFTGFIGLLFMPFVGAVLGEMVARWRAGDAATRAGQGRAVKVGVGTWLGMLAGIAIKLALVFGMLGVFAIAYVA